MYFIIDTGPDGICVMQKTKGELQKMIAPDRYGDVELDVSKVLNGVPDTDPNYWGGGFLIIKGEIAVPKEREVVTLYEIE